MPSYYVYTFASKSKKQITKFHTMKKVILAISATALFAIASCKKEDKTPLPEDAGIYEILSGDITTDMTLSASKKYKLEGFVYVKDGATLHIEPGTVIVGDKASKATLVITRSGKINAAGTADRPIVFTSAYEPGIRNAGDWGGIILLGKAPVNVDGGEAKIEGGALPSDAANEKDYIWYGGSDAEHSSGTLKHVRIEFAGVAYSADNEINSLTMGGVGRGTTISYIQVYKAGDDAFEWFGGTVNCDHLIATYTVDDDIDTDLGYNGNIQYVLIQRAKNIADVSGSNGFESDNNGNGTSAMPQTAATISNVTYVGPYEGTTFSGISLNYQNAAQIRRNSAQSFHNSIFMGAPVGLYLDNTKGTPTTDNIAAGRLAFNHNIIAGCKEPLKTSAPFTIAEMESWFARHGNTILESTLDVQLKDPYKFSNTVSSKVGRPDFRLNTTSPAMTGASFAGLSGFETTSYVGAFDSSNDWTLGWAEFDADNATY